MADRIINDVERKTAQHQFFSCNPKGDGIFAVSEGLPVEDAINTATAIMCSARDTIIRLAEKHDDSELWGASYLLEMATAVMESAARGIAKEQHHG